MVLYNLVTFTIIIKWEISLLCSVSCKVFLSFILLRRKWKQIKKCVLLDKLTYYSLIGYGTLHFKIIHKPTKKKVWVQKFKMSLSHLIACGFGWCHAKGKLQLSSFHFSLITFCLTWITSCCELFFFVCDKQSLKLCLRLLDEISFLCYVYFEWENCLF